MRNTRGVDSYRKNKVLTGSPGDLMLMLYDEGIRVCALGRKFIDEKNYDEACLNLLKAQRIVEELMNSLKADVYPEMIANLRRLLEFAYSRLMEGNVAQDTALISEAEKVLTDLRDIWRIAIDNAKAEAYESACAQTTPGNIELSA